MARQRPPADRFRRGRDHITELIARYWKFAEKHYTKDGEATGELAALRSAFCPLEELYGATAGAEFGPLRLEALRMKMISFRWARRNIDHSVNRVRRLFRWGVSKQLLPAAVIEAQSTVDGLRRGKTTARGTAPIKASRGRSSRRDAAVHAGDHRRHGPPAAARWNAAGSVDDTAAPEVAADADNR